MKKILLVDKSSTTLDLLTQCLDSDNYEIITSETGANAILKAELFEPDLIIMDTDLPDISSFNVCKVLKDSKITEFILILLISLSESKETKLRAIEVGADDFMHKTFEPSILIAKVRSLLKIKSLSDQLKLKYVELEEKNTILDFQLKMGRQVQRSLIPEIDSKYNNIHVVSKYLPAMDVGGDFYDVIKITNNYIGIVMGDVSGHGISAALITAMLNMMFNNNVSNYYDPSHLLYFINKQFCKIFKNDTSGIYACVFYAIIDTSNMKIYYSNAGQTLPILVNIDSNTTVDLTSSGTPIGLIPDATYEKNEIDYKKGDLLFFHTDGLSDTYFKESNADFSLRLNKLLLENCRNNNCNEIIENILSEFYNFNPNSKEKYTLDDVSLLLCVL
jgi:phosphoserine phosphatase RsbU/P